MGVKKILARPPRGANASILIFLYLVREEEAVSP